MIKHPTSFFPANYVNEQYSYPSGHAARAVFLAILLGFTMKKRVWIMVSLILFVILISLSRIYLGHHWLSDVIGGLILGSGSGLLTISILLSYNRKRNEWQCLAIIYTGLSTETPRWRVFLIRWLISKFLFTNLQTINPPKRTFVPVNTGANLNEGGCHIIRPLN